MAEPRSPRDTWGGGCSPELLLELAHRFLAEVQPELVYPSGLSMDSHLERDLGLDSLSRAELAARVEEAVGLDLPERTLGTVVTLRDLLEAFRSAGSVVPSADAAGPDAWSEGAESPPDTVETLIDVLEWHVGAHPERVQIRYLSETGPIDISYRALSRQAGLIAAGLQGIGLEPGMKVAIMLPTCPAYFHAYFGILRAGGVPVPIYPPARLSQIAEHVRRHAGILANAQASVLITVPEARGVARLLEVRTAGLRRVITADELAASSDRLRPVALRPDDTAFIQYTSGSTGDPKGVVLSHANLLANIRAACRATRMTADDVFVSWLPLYHDMGLISAWLSSLYMATPLVVMSPLSFLARPERWLRAIERYGGTISAAPNFGYELCVKRIDDSRIKGLDLSSWRLAANGAEPVVPGTLRRFIERFESYGFRAGAMTPVYGLAECTVGLLCPPLGRGPRIDTVRRGAMTRMGRAEPAEPDDADAISFVSCGLPLQGHEVRVVDALGHEVAERVEGRLEFRGPSATSGYHRNPEQTRRLLHGGWLDTGDRAYQADGEIFLTGRVKDMIIRGGRNIYPHELENAVGTLEGVRRGCVAVFGSGDPDTGTERLVVLAETRVKGPEAEQRLRERIIDRTGEVLGEPPDQVVLAPPHTVLKTSSGKIRRAACRELYAGGRVSARRHPVWWQLAGLLGGSVLPWCRKLLAAGAHLIYGLYVWLLCGLLGPPTWLLTAIAPRPAFAWGVNRWAARQLLRLAGVELTVLNSEKLPAGPCVLVANHASYVDGLILFAAMPRPFRFVVKREFLKQPLARAYLRGLGAWFVERFDADRSVREPERMAAALRMGDSPAFFPEGTFGRAAGLGPFRLGAFVAAVSGRAPVLPVALRGTRTLLRNGQWLPRRAPVLVTVGPPVGPASDALDPFAAAVSLRDSARARIQAGCGEPDAA